MGVNFLTLPEGYSGVMRCEFKIVFLKAFRAVPFVSAEKLVLLHCFYFILYFKYHTILTNFIYGFPKLYSSNTTRSITCRHITYFFPCNRLSCFPYYIMNRNLFQTLYITYQLSSFIIILRSYFWYIKKLNNKMKILLYYALHSL